MRSRQVFVWHRVWTSSVVNLKLSMRASGLDDASLHRIDMEKRKAFNSITDEDAKSFERWGASTYAMNGPRGEAANAIDLFSEPESLDI
eukprot:12077128-Karenia_brevis.AAC.1